MEDVGSLTRRFGWLLVLGIVTVCGGDDALAMPPSQSQAQAQAQAQAHAQSQAQSPSPPPITPSACHAPSLTSLSSRDDSLTLAVLDSCPADDPFVARVSREQPVASRCGTTGARADIARILDSALPLDDTTAAHVRTIFAAGRARGRHPDVFGLVGDSITVQTNFMTPFAHGSGLRVSLAPE